MSINQFKRKRIKLSTANNAETKLLVEIVSSYFKDFDVTMETKLNHIDFLLFGEKYAVDRVADSIRKLAAMIGQFVTANYNGERLLSADLLPQVIKGAIDLKFLQSILGLFGYTAELNTKVLKTNAPVSVVTELAQTAFHLLQSTSSTQNLDLRKFNVLMQLKFTTSEDTIYTWGQMHNLLGYKFAKYYFKKPQNLVIDAYLSSFTNFDITPSSKVNHFSFFEGGKMVLSDDVAQLLSNIDKTAND